MARKSWARKADGCGSPSQNASRSCQIVPQGAGRRDALLAHALRGLQFLSLAPLERTSNPVRQLPRVLSTEAGYIQGGCEQERAGSGGDALAVPFQGCCGPVPQGCEPPPCSDPALGAAVLTLRRSHCGCCISLLLYVKTREVFKYLLSLETPEAGVHLYKRLGFFFFTNCQ